MLGLKPESDRMLHLDLLRFAAAVAILVNHFLKATEGLDTTWSRSLVLAVDLFFVISGFVISDVYADKVGTVAGVVTFLRKRVARLVPLHWATMAAFVVLAAWTRVETTCAAQNLLLIHAWGMCERWSFNTVSWSISAEMGMYLLFPLIAPMVVKRSRAALTAAVLIAIALYALGPAGPRDRWWYNWTTEFGVIRALPSFLFGAALFGLRAELARLPFARPILYGGLAMFLGGAIADVPSGLLLPVLWVVAVAAVAADRQGHKGRGLLIIASLAGLTYSLYMLHPVVGRVFISILGEHVLQLHGSALNGWVALAVVPTFALSWASYLWFEKPLRRWISGTDQPRSAPQPAT